MHAQTHGQPEKGMYSLADHWRTHKKRAKVRRHRVKITLMAQQHKAVVLFSVSWTRAISELNVRRPHLFHQLPLPCSFLQLYQIIEA